jgi:hypothetical protein
MKPLKLPKDLEWQSLPTFEDLQKRATIRIPALRVRLLDVKCYRCPDNTVRYDEAEAAAALAEAPCESDAVSAIDDDADELEQLRSFGGGAAQGLPHDQPISLLALFRMVLGMLADQRKDRADVIKSMQQPLETGLKLTDLMVDKLMARLSKYEDDADDMTRLMREIMDASTDRDLKIKKTEQSIRLRGDMGEMIKKNAPLALQKWTLTREATLAVEVLGSIDPKVFDFVVTPDFIADPAALGRAKELVELLKKRQAAAKAQQQPPANEVVDTTATAATEHPPEAA